MKYLVFSFLLFFIINAKSQNNNNYHVASSSKGKVKEIVVGSDETYLDIIVDLIENLSKSRAKDDTLLVIMENKYSNIQRPQIQAFYNRIGLVEYVKLAPEDFQNIDFEDFKKYKSADFLEIPKNELIEYYFQNEEIINRTLPAQYEIEIDDQELEDIQFEIPEETIEIRREYLRSDNSELKLIQFIESTESFYKLNDLKIEKDLSDLPSFLTKVFKTYFTEYPNIKLININSNNNYETGHSLWIQDMFTPINNGSEIICLYNDKNIQIIGNESYIDSICKIPQINKKPISFDIQGGNISFLNSEIAFIAKDALINPNTGKINQQKLNRIKKEFNLEIVHLVGTKSMFNNASSAQLSYQPLFHLDLYFNSIQIENESIILLAEFVTDNEGIDDKIELWNTALNEISENLQKLEFRVVRIPLYYNKGVSFSFHNGIIESINDKTIAYIPEYENSVPSIHKNNFVNILESLNIEVKFIKTKSGNLTRLLEDQGGSIHCITKVLRRN